jgi:hypothetical protein
MLLVLVYFHVILIPGVLVLYLVYDSVKPRRGVAVTTNGVTDLKLSVIDGRPVTVLAATDHDALLRARIQEQRGRNLVHFQGEDISLRDSDLWRLRVAVSAVPVRVAGTDDPSLPPPPGMDLAAAASEPDARLPRWREATILWVLAHLAIGLTLFIAILIIANAVSRALGRDIEHTSASADIYLWVTFVGSIAAWMLFVYWRGTFRRRLLIFGVVTSATLLICCVANFVYSPLAIH